MCRVDSQVLWLATIFWLTSLLRSLPLHTNTCVRRLSSMPQFLKYESFFQRWYVGGTLLLVSPLLTEILPWKSAFPSLAKPLSDRSHPDCTSSSHRYLERRITQTCDNSPSKRSPVAGREARWVHTSRLDDKGLMDGKPGPIS